MGDGGRDGERDVSIFSVSDMTRFHLKTIQFSTYP